MTEEDPSIPLDELDSGLHNWQLKDSGLALYRLCDSSKPLATLPIGGVTMSRTVCTIAGSRPVYKWALAMVCSAVRYY